MIDVFRECRERVSARDAACYYGVEINRQGKARCPFHSERTPSLGFKNGRFKCFGCGASGDSITFTGRLLGLKPLAAVERLNTDFSLALPLHRKPTQKEAEVARQHIEVVKRHKKFEAWRENFISRLCAAYREGYLALRHMTNWEQLTEREALAIRLQPQLEYWLDTLSYGTAENQAQIYRESEKIAKWIQKIMND